MKTEFSTSVPKHTSFYSNPYSFTYLSPSLDYKLDLQKIEESQKSRNAIAVFHFYSVH